MKNIYEYDINKNEIINDSKLLPTDKESQNYDWLWANNNKYENIEINPKKIGKWMLFPDDKEVNIIWNNIKKIFKMVSLDIQKFLQIIKINQIVMPLWFIQKIIQILTM